MRKYRNDSLINEHKSVYINSQQFNTIIQVLAPFNLHTIKGEWTAGQLSNLTQRRRDDNLQVFWRASPRVLCSKLHTSH